MSAQSADAPVGRDTPMAISALHTVNGRRMTPPCLKAAGDRVGAGVLLGRRALFWQLPGVFVTAVGYAGGVTPNPTYQETCTGRTGHAEVVRVVFDPTEITLDTLLRHFWEAHDPTQGNRQATTSAPSIARSSSRSTMNNARWPSVAALPMPRRWRLRQGGGHHRDRTARGVLLRRGISPAVSRQEPWRLLRPQGDRRQLPDWLKAGSETVARSDHSSSCRSTRRASQLVGWPFRHST